jgi:transposase
MTKYRHRHLNHTNSAKVGRRKNGTTYKAGETLNSTECESIVDLYLSGKSKSHIRKVTGCAYNTITKYIHKFESRTDINPNGNVLQGEHQRTSIEHLIDMITREEPELTLDSVKQEIFRLTNISMSLQEISRIRHDHLNYRIKVVDRRDQHRHTERVQELRQQYIQRIRQYSMHKLIFIDESHFEFADCNRGRGAFIRGSRPVLVNGRVSKCKWSLLCAIGSLSIPHYQIHNISHKSIDTNDMLSFVEELHTNVPEDYVFVLDNASLHTSNQFQRETRTLNRHFIYLPPYHPEFNPIEFLFSEIKRRLYGTNIEDLNENLTQLLSQYHSNEYRKLYNYFHHSVVTNIQ